MISHEVYTLLLKLVYIIAKRLSARQLLIEQGRYQNIPIDVIGSINFVNFYTYKVEGEFHFILVCPIYINARVLFIKRYYTGLNHLCLNLYNYYQYKKQLCIISQNIWNTPCYLDLNNDMSILQPRPFLVTPEPYVSLCWASIARRMGLGLTRMISTQHLEFCISYVVIYTCEPKDLKPINYTILYMICMS